MPLPSFPFASESVPATTTAAMSATTTATMSAATTAMSTAAAAMPTATAVTAGRTVDFSLVVQCFPGIGKAEFCGCCAKDFLGAGFGGAGRKPHRKIIDEGGQYKGKERIAYVFHGLGNPASGQKGMNLAKSVGSAQIIVAVRGITVYIVRDSIRVCVSDSLIDCAVAENINFPVVHVDKEKRAAIG